MTLGGSPQKEQLANSRKRKKSINLWSGGTPLYGYKIENKNNIIINQDTAITVKEIFEDYLLLDYNTNNISNN